MSDPAVIAAVSAAAAIAAAVITAFLSRRSASEANKIASEANKIAAFETSLDGLSKVVDGLSKVVDAQGKVVVTQDGRIESLERELGTVKTALVEEQQRHGVTRELFRLALKHIRYMRAWLDTDRSAEPPWVPEELHPHL